ncbi:MAG: radical SAM protein [Candidatus Omnitrophota bacterium]
MEVKEVKVSGILNPTSIDIGEYVINPYRGCAYSCLYCYARFNKVALKDPRAWGTYVDARINAPQLLERELAVKKPTKVLLGSTTECFQPCEADHEITKKVLEILINRKVFFSILSRSPGILRYMDLLKSGYCDAVYFTVNSYPPRLKSLLEPYSPSFEARAEAVNTLIKEKVRVIPYFSPVLPYISGLENVFSIFPGSDRVEFEALNFSLGNIGEVMERVERVYPELMPVYRRMLSDEGFYRDVWSEVKNTIMKEAAKEKKEHKIYTHRFNAYFVNTYSRVRPCREAEITEASEKSEL